MLQVRVLRLGYRVVIDIDHVIQHAHCGLDGALQFLGIQTGLGDVVDQIDRAQVAHGDLILAGVQRDLGAQVGGVDGAHMLLRRAHITGILESDPWMTGFKQHGQHLAPQILGAHGLVDFHLAGSGLALVFFVSLFECHAVQIMQIRYIVG